MNVELKYEEVIADINDRLKGMQNIAEKEERTALRKIGNVIKRNVIKFTDDSHVEARARKISPSNYDRSKPYVHMRKDVSVKVAKDKLGRNYVSVRGGKYTGYKWHLINDGHLARDGATFVPGTNFMGRASSASEGEIEQMIDAMIEKVVE